MEFYGVVQVPTTVVAPLPLLVRAVLAKPPAAALVAAGF